MSTWYGRVECDARVLAFEQRRPTTIEAMIDFDGRHNSRWRPSSIPHLPYTFSSTMNEESIGHDIDSYRIALYYCYIPVNVEEHINFQTQLCTCDGRILKGRIRVASEGINGVLSGRIEHLKDYEALLKAHLSDSTEGCVDLDMKYCHLRQDLDVEQQLFKELSVQRTKHVISLVEPQPSDNGMVKAELQPQSRRRREQVKEKNQPDDDVKLVESLWSAAQEEIQKAPDAVSANHLSPAEWNARLENVSVDDNAIILDCRNFYESNLGHFVAPNQHATTLLTNTRRFSELPLILVKEKDRFASSKQIFMYCTGGVRCERASAFLNTLLKENRSETEVFQLRGGIQRYMEHTPQEGSSQLFRGKNFVFDPRRTDPLQSDDTVGTCIVCGVPHDDYDNGHAPMEGKEARCCACRILILVCNSCRTKTACWGEDHTGKALAYCGGAECICKPEPREIKGGCRLSEQTFDS